MKKLFVSLIVSISLVSCSSIDKSMIYSGLAGAVIGGFVGRYASPNIDSDKFNTALGVAVGSALGAGVGAYFFKLDPDNRSMKTMLSSESIKRPNPNEYDIGTPVSEKYYTVNPDTKNVPANLKDKIKKQIIIEKIIPERVVKGEGGKSTLIPETKVIEYDYQ